MKAVLIPLALLVALSACNESPKVDEKDASAAEIAQKVRETGADQAMIRPGLWESKLTIDKFEVPGMPPEVQSRMRTMMAEQQEHSAQSCLTKEDVQRPKEDFFAGKNNECRYERFTMGSGKIDATMQCGRGKSVQRMQMAGTYSPDNYQMQMSTSMTSPDEKMNGTIMQMRVDSKRIGDCKA